MTDTVKPDETQNIEDDDVIIEDDTLLGKYISHHPVNRFRLVVQAGIVYFIATTALQLLFYSLDDQLASILLIFLFAALALGLGWYVLHLWNREVVIYEKGCNYREGSIVADFMYDEVETFHQQAERLNYFGGLYKRNVFTFTVRTFRDEVVKLSNLYTDIEKLGHNLEHGINSVLREKVRHSLLMSESVSFGSDFKLSDRSIIANGQELMWEDFRAYAIQGGNLTIASHTDENWYQIPLNEVANLTLLIEILRQKLPART